MSSRIVAGQLQQIALGIFEEERSRCHGAKYRGLWVQPERQETLLVILQALGWDFERQMIQRGSCRLVPNETFTCR